MGAKEKTEKEKGTIPRPAEVEEMPEAVKETLNPATKESAVC